MARSYYKRLHLPPHPPEHASFESFLIWEKYAALRGKQHRMSEGGLGVNPRTGELHQTDPGEPVVMPAFKSPFGEEDYDGDFPYG
jgi:hypothetical protein